MKFATMSPWWELRTQREHKEERCFLLWTNGRGALYGVHKKNAGAAKISAILRLASSILFQFSDAFKLPYLF